MGIGCRVRAGCRTVDGHRPLSRRSSRTRSILVSVHTLFFPGWWSGECGLVTRRQGRRVRGAAADPEQLLICTGFRQGLSLTCRWLRANGIERVALEDPGWHAQRLIVEEAGLEVIPIPVDGDGISLAALGASDAEAVVAFLTSSPPGEDADDEGVTRLRAAVDRRFEAGGGTLRITKETGAFVCRQPRPTG